MAITGTFKADFASFLTAVDKAELALVDMSKGANKVESSLNRMADNFSGRKVIQEASLMTIALEKAGGSSILTAKELEVVGNKANEAADKLRRLGYEVPPGLQKLVAEAHNATTASTGLASALASTSSLLSTFGIGVGLTAVVSMGKAVLDDADALVKMRDKTGIAVEGLQILRTAGDDSGNTLDELTSAVNKMQQRIAGGDDSALGALAKLGIKFSDFRTLAPDQQFIAIGNAIKNVKDPADQVRLAVDLFGKAGAEVLPTLKRGFDDLKDSVGVMSTSSIEALDRLGDNISHFWRSTKGLVGEAVGVVVARAFADIKSVQILLGALPDLPKAPAGVDTFKALTAPGLPEGLSGVTKDLEEQYHKIAKAADDARKANEKFRESVQSLSFKQFVVDGIPMVGLIRDLSDRSGKFRDGLDDLDGTLNEFHNGLTIAGDEMATVTIPLFSKLPDVVARSTRELEHARDAVEKISFSGGLKDIVSGKGFGQIGSALSGAINPSKIINTAIGGALSGGISSLVNLGIQGIGSLFSKLFGNPEKEINPIREAFVQAAGGLDALNKHAQEAGVTLDRFLNAKNAQQYQAAVEELTKAFDAQKSKIEADSTALGILLHQGQDLGIKLPPALQAALKPLVDMGKITGDTADLFKRLSGDTEVDFKKMADVAGKYGIDLAALGPQFQSARLHDSAANIINDFDLLTRGGADVGGVLFGMRGSISGLVQDSLKFGIDIPANMKPWIEELSRSGNLVDENGDKITDLSGLKFADPIKTEFQKIVDKLQELIDKISGANGVTAAINNIPTQRTVHIGFDVDGFPDVGRNYAARGGLVTATGIQYLGYGGNVLPFARGSDTVPAMLTPGERVLSVDQARAYAAGGNAVDMQAVVAELRALRQDQQNLPKLIRDAVQLAS